MHSVPIVMPSAEALQRFGTENKVDWTSLVKLTWSLVLHSYFDTHTFVFYEEHMKPDNESYEDSVSGSLSVLEFRPELAKSTSILAALRSRDTKNYGRNIVLREVSDEGSYKWQQKFSSEVQILQNGSEQIQQGQKTTHGSRKSQLILVISFCDSTLTSCLHHDEKLEESYDIGSIARAFSEGLKSVLATNSEYVADISLLSEPDTRRIFEGNSNPLQTVKDCLHNLVGKSVFRSPESVALQSWDGCLTYMELDCLSSRLARHLYMTFEVGPGTIVPLLFPKSMWTVVAMLAVLKTGAAYCCLDPAHPTLRRSYVIDIVGASFVLTDLTFAQLIKDHATLVVSADLLAGLSHLGASQIVDVDPSSPCMVAFTSGSTGHPKGILHNHVTVCSGLVVNAPAQSVDESIRMFQWGAYTYDISLTEIFTPLIYGGIVCIPSEEERLNQVEECMIRMNVNWAFFTPSFARASRNIKVPSLKSLTLGGEAMTIDDVNDWTGKVQVFNCFGPAETVSWFFQPQLGFSEIISIGKPINMYAWIVDPEDHFRLMPPGAIGELILEGPAVFLEYIKNPEKTQQTLIDPPPWRTLRHHNANSKLYKTGDLVRYLPDTTMTFVGRKDTMVKIRGQRMELDEVELYLRRYLPESVQSAAEVIIPAGRREEPILVAFLCFGDEEGDHSLQSLRQHLLKELSKTLPRFMVPAVYLPIRSMPYSSSLKIDRRALQAHVSNLTRSQLIGLAQTNEAPTTEEDEESILNPVEKAIQKLWAESLLLDPSQIGCQDNFFSLGGTSITVMRVITTARQNGILFSYSDMFRTPSLRALAQISSTNSTNQRIAIAPFSLIKESVRDIVVADTVAQCMVSEDMIEDVYPLTPLQQGLWALSMIQEGGHMCQFILSLNPKTDVHKLCAAMELVVDHIPTLRTRIVQSASGSYQAVIKGGMQWQVASGLEDYLQNDITRDIDMGQPIVRFALISDMPSSSEDTIDVRHKIVWTAHHALCDGESAPLFLNLVARAYRGTLPDERFASFKHLVKYIQNSENNASANHWKSEFRSINPIQYPALPSSSYRPNPVSVYRKSIDFNRRPGSRITTATLLRAAWALTMVKASKSPDVAIGVVVTGREVPVQDIEIVVGPTLATFPIRTLYDPKECVRDYLQRTQSAVVETVPYEHTGIQNIRDLSPQCSAACQFQNIFIVQTLEDTSYSEVFSCDFVSDDLSRFNSLGIMLLSFLKDDGTDVVCSFDDHIINEHQIIQHVADFQHFIHILCLEEESRLLATLVGTDVFSNSRRLSETASLGESMNNFSPIKSNFLHTRTDPLPATEMELLMAKVWVEVLRLPDNIMIRLHDEFFSTFGGDSLAALRLVQAVRVHGLRITVQNIFRYPALVNMAEVVSSVSPIDELEASIVPFSLLQHDSRMTETQESATILKVKKEAAIACGVPMESVLDIYPSTPLQEGLLALSAAEPDSYISRTVYYLTDDVDIDRFCRSWDKVFKETDILRTRIFQSSRFSRALQVVLSCPIIWQNSTNLDLYLKENAQISMGFGTPLNRFAIVQDLAKSKKYFVLIIHHAHFDGWSIPLLLDRVYDSYFGQALASQNIPFVRFIKRIGSFSQSDHETYWKGQLQGATPTSFIDRPISRVNHQNQINLDCSIQIPSGSQESGVLISTVLRAAWALLLATYTNTQDVIFGAALSGRNVNLTKIDRMAGPTITTVPIRIRFEKRIKVGEFLRLVQDQGTDMIEFEHSGLQFIRQVAPESCDFDTLLVVQLKSIPTDYSQLWTTSREIPSNFFNYPLVLTCKPMEDNSWIQATGTFDESRLRPSQMRRILNQYRHVVLQLLNLNDSITLDKVEFISPEDVHELQEWNAYKTEVVEKCLHELLIERIHSNPDSIAIVSSNAREITYRELYELSSRLALHLIKLGSGPGVMIPVIFEKSPWAIVAMLAVLISGAAYVPIAPEHPHDRRAFLLRQIKTFIVLASPKYIGLIKDYETLGIDEDYFDRTPSIEKGDKTISNVRVSPSDPAYICFTSGSSGVPKGVVIQHRSICTSIRGHGRAMGFNSQTRALQFSSYIFDVSVAEIFTTLSFGGTVCTPSSEGLLDHLAKEIQHLHVNWSWLTPTVARLVEPPEVPALETLVLGGEEVDESDICRWKESTVRLMESYGPAETSVFSAVCDINSSLSAKTFGKAVGCSNFIVDPDHHEKLSPIGAIGELIIAGSIVGSGYLDNPEGTNAVFITAPRWAEGLLGKMARSQKFYKTGDLVRYNHCGQGEYVSRKDFQVKIRGQRIELQEIEHWIRTCNAIKHAVALLPRKGDFGARKQIVAVVEPCHLAKKHNSEPLKQIPSQDAEPLIMKLQSILAEHLPVSSIPMAWIAVNKIPLSPTGKTDRRFVIDWVEDMSKQDYVDIYSRNLSVQDSAPKPESVLEKKIQHVWSSVLGIPAEHMVANKSFLSYGGDSISALRVLQKCRAESLILSIKDLLTARGITHLAEIESSSRLSREGRKGNKPSTGDQAIEYSSVQRSLVYLGSLEEANIEDIFECSPLQEAMLSKQSIGFYNVEMLFEIKCRDTLDVQRLRNAWRQVVQKHSALRIVFSQSRQRQDRHYQIVLRQPPKFSVTWKQTQEEQTTLQLSSSVPFDPGYDKYSPPHRLTIEQTLHKIYMKLEISHIISDGASLAICFHDLALAYDFHLANNLAIPQFQQYIMHTSRHAEEDHLYWKEYCAQSTPCYILPTNISAAPETEMQLLYTSIEYDRTTDLLAFCQQNSVSVAHFFHAIWAMVLRLHTSESQKNEVIFGYLISGRDVEIDSVEECVGLLLSELACRQVLDDQVALRELLVRMRDDFAVSSGRWFCNLKKVEQELGLDKTRLFNSVINFRKYPAPIVTSSDESRNSISFEYLKGFDPFEHDMMVLISERETENRASHNQSRSITWDITLAHWSTRIGTNQAAKIAQDFTSILECMLRDSARSIGDALEFVRLNGHGEREVDGRWTNDALGTADGGK